MNDGTVLLNEVVLAESLADRMRGLLGRSELPSGTGMLLRPCRSIHMLGMRFPIDAAFLDREMRVLKIARDLRPGQLGFAPPGTDCVLEAAAGAMARLEPGARLRLE